MVRACVVAIVLAATGCRDDEVARLEEVREEVCACKTILCANQAMKKLPARDAEPSYRAQNIAKRMMECVARLHAAGRPTTDPDAEAPAP